MKAPQQQAMLKEIRVKIFYLGKSKDTSRKSTVIFEGPGNVLFDTSTKSEILPIIWVSGHIY